jgi:anti-sigma factor RsiW
LNEARKDDMHDVIQNGLEDYLDGKVRREFQAHLDQCAGCRGEVREFQEVSGLMHALRVPEPAQPAAGFFLRVEEGIEARKRSSLWNVFSLNAAFGRRVAFASLMTLAVVGSVLVSQERDYEGGPARGPEAIMASHDVAAYHTADSDRDQIMLALASYDH